MDATYPVLSVLVFEDNIFMRKECPLIFEALYELEASLHTNSYVQAHTHTQSDTQTQMHTHTCCCTVVAMAEHT